MENENVPIIQDGEIVKVVMPSAFSKSQVAQVSSKSGRFGCEVPVPVVKEKMGDAIQRYFYARLDCKETIGHGASLAGVDIGEEAPWQTW